MPQQWIFREYQNGDECAILQLRNLAISDRKSLEWWRWLYQNNPAGKAIIILAQTETLIGQYGLIPLRIKVGDKLELGGICLDLMVLPDFRGMGLFSQMAKKAFDIAHKRNLQIVYGFPNANAHPGYISKLNWTDLHNGLPLWVKPLNFKNLFMKYTRNNNLISKLLSLPCQLFTDLVYDVDIHDPKLRIEPTKYFDDHFNQLWESLETYAIMIVHDKAFLNWRYVEKPDSDYTILTAWNNDDLVGYIVLGYGERFGLQIGIIVDILISPECLGATKELISTAVSFFQNRNMDLVGILMLPKAYLAQTLKQEKFFLIPRKILPAQGYIGMRALQNQSNDDVLTNPSNWFITWGDSDIM